MIEALKWRDIILENCDKVEGKSTPILFVQNKLDEIKISEKIEEY